MPTPASPHPEVYEYLEAERIKYAIRLPATGVLQERIGYLLQRPVGRPSNDVRRSYANFTYQAGSWNKPRRVVAKGEWHLIHVHDARVRCRGLLEVPTG